MLSFSLLAGAFLCLSIEQRFACSRFFRTDVSSSQHSLNNLATLYHDMKNHENAVQFYKDAVQMYQQLGLEHTDVARSLNNLATLYCDQGKYEEAEPLYQQALEIRKRYL